MSVAIKAKATTAIAKPEGSGDSKASPTFPSGFEDEQCHALVTGKNF